MITLEDGTGVADADTYLDPEGSLAAAFLAAGLYLTAWTGATTDNREIAVRQATAVLDEFCEWEGNRSTSTQALGWPRTGVCVDGVRQTGVPRPVAKATFLLANDLLAGNRLADPGGGGAQPLTSLSLGQGAVALSFGDDPAAGAPAHPLSKQIRVLLRAYATITGAGSARVRRK